MRQNFVASYSLDLPLQGIFDRTGRLTEGWALSDTTRFTTGLPVTLYDDSDNSLLGTVVSQFEFDGLGNGR
jgi:hypothetical protein